MRFKFSFVTTLALLLMLNGCVLFTSHYDATRHENFTKLKAIHMKFFSDWGVESKKTWNKDEVSVYCDKGDLSYREAFEFAKSKDDSDKAGQDAVKYLWQEFSANCALSLKKKKLFSKTFMEELLPEIKDNYKYAIAGELSRVKAPK